MGILDYKKAYVHVFYDGLENLNKVTNLKRFAMHFVTYLWIPQPVGCAIKIS